DAKITIIESSKDLLVIDKPASIPIHSCGRYAKNTILNILKQEHQLDPLFPVHRLDRMTSGVVIFGKTSEKAKELATDISSHLVTKTYLARVVGKFPSEMQMVDKKIA